ncbi:DUF4185 domain-containing protein [Mycobacterium sp. EPa45]|uniref:DUF4185 domain-containing protein n=1 Tax=Mycobacterium sp. EPa45 TaxID=1545728 RepID=UPI000B300D20|nr:DUF4185 domain-containing protein [Mycobacterium sp. EPa45]
MAITLGVGVAVASGSGVAWADETGSPPASDTTSSNVDGQPKNTVADSSAGAAKPALPSPAGATAGTVTGAATSPLFGGATRPKSPSEVLATLGMVMNSQRAQGDTSGSSKSSAPAPSRRRAAVAPTADTAASTPSASKQTAAQNNPINDMVHRVGVPLQAAGEKPVDAVSQNVAALAAPIVTTAAAPVITGQSAAAAVEAPASTVTGGLPAFGRVLAALGLGPLAANSPLAPGDPPVLWGLLAWARREFDSTVSRLGGTAPGSVPAQSFATAAVATGPTTTPVAWVTGSGTTGPYLLTRTNNTGSMFGIGGTDLGIMWDNGIKDDPATPVNEHQVLMAFGDTFSGTGQSGIWRSNTLLRSSDPVLSDGISVAPGQLGNVFSGSPLSSPNFSKQIINSPGYLGPQGSEVTIIPTSGVSVPYNNAYGSRQYVSVMSVKSWDTPGRWTTNYSAIAYSDDNGQTWTIAPSSIRSAASYRTTTGYVSGNQNFQQSAFVRPPAGSADANYVYVYGTPSGRGGTVYLSRVQQADILDQTKYQYWNGTTWVANKPSAATPVLPATTTTNTGLLGWFSSLFGGGTTKTYPSAGEMSVQYNTYLKKYVMMYADNNNNVVMRTADRPEGPWSAPTTLATSTQYPGLYAPMMDPWSTGQDIYWNMSMWGDYNVLLMHTRLP